MRKARVFRQMTRSGFAAKCQKYHTRAWRVRAAKLLRDFVLGQSEQARLASIGKNDISLEEI